LFKPLVRFRIDFAKHCSVGPGKIDLLEAIQRFGSLSQAARTLKMSYRYAWLLLDNLNTSFREPMTTASVGGKGGGGVVLTPFGEQIIRAYREFERDLEQVAERHLAPLADLPSKAAPKKPIRRKLARSSGGAQSARMRSAATSGRN
jgi:molybdate transport system regulatory protein